MLLTTNPINNPGVKVNYQTLELSLDGTLKPSREVVAERTGLNYKRRFALKDDVDEGRALMAGALGLLTTGMSLQEVKTALSLHSTEQVGGVSATPVRPQRRAAALGA